MTKEELTRKVLARLQEKGLKRFSDSFETKVGQIIISLQNTFPWNNDEEIVNMATEQILKRINEGSLDSSFNILTVKTKSIKNEEEGKEQSGSKKAFNILTLQTKTEKPREEPPSILRVYNWATHLTHEEEAAEAFIMPRPEWKRLVRRLIYTSGNLIKVVGPQGAGKTTMANYLYRELSKVENKRVRFRSLQKGYEEFGHWKYYKSLEKVEDVDGVKKKWVVSKDRDWEWYYTDDTRTFLIDLWDYSKSSQKDIIKALDAIQDYWRYRCNLRKSKLNRGEKSVPVVPNIVIFLQKEALPLHFFLGKMTFFELKPWKPEDLVKYYKEAFKGTFPFTEEALREVAALSRGIFRKFKEYIAACLDEFLSEGINYNKKITVNDVRRIITTEKLVQDMELQLCELWPRSRENRVLAVKVLRYLREKGPTLQKEIAEKFFAENLMACSRLLNKLAHFGYVKSKKEGVERRWEIA
ncbi:hypothetical protein DRO19_02520 [Candidatus Bathyarchaeota archaeon]|nr:MAG: hypothetical protein DRO19_02520 [Candidatus Bathyarchaeota archaeon]